MHPPLSLCYHDRATYSGALAGASFFGHSAKKEADMSAIAGSAAATLLAIILTAPALPAQTIATASPSAGMSKVRIVRLSQVIGAVRMDRGVGRGFETAIQNLPVVESSRIRTEAGAAEIEFEDNSTLRVAPDSEVDFPELERTGSGMPVTEVRVVRGMAYFSLTKNRDSEFTLEFGPGTKPEELRLPPSSHVRLQVDATGARLAVLGGTVQVSGADGPITVPRKRTVSFSFTQTNQPTITRNVAAESLDAWDRQSAEYHEQVAAVSAFGNAPASYGLNDLAYYGAFSDAGGCGMMWYPYFAGAAWYPYADGVWAWYGGTSYSWVSPYPWGWMPYHYGSWSYCPGNGWGWMPGGAWNGLGNVPAISSEGSVPRKSPLLPRPPAGPPRAGHPTLTLVMTRPLVASAIDQKGSFIFRRDSAGLGIPRQGLGKLRNFSRNTLRRGTASTPVYLSLDTDGGVRSEGARAARDSQLAPVTIHRGFAPAPVVPSPSVYVPSNTTGGDLPAAGSTSLPSRTSGMPSSPGMGGGTPRGGGGGATGNPH